MGWFSSAKDEVQMMRQGNDSTERKLIKEQEKAERNGDDARAAHYAGRLENYRDMCRGWTK